MTEAKTVRLGDLAPDPVAIDGREDRLSKIDDLLASLPVLGQLQSLRVRPWSGGDAPTGRSPVYGVTAGNRRLAALRKLAETGVAIQGKVVTDDFPVHVVLGDDDDATAFSGTVAENVQRLPETVVGEFRAFAKMAEHAKPKEIATTFGVSEKRVNQRLKLAALHPDVIKALEDGKIKLDAAEAFTLVEPEKQAAFLKKAVGYQLEEYYIRREFTAKLINGGSAIAQIIGMEAYKKAGGKVLGDVFTEQAYWISTELIDKLLKAHWTAEVKKWTAQGWAFVESADQFCSGNKWSLKSDYEHLKPEGGSKKAPEFTAEQKAKAGVVYFEDGSEAPHFGVKRTKRQYRAPVQEPDLDKPPYEARELLEDLIVKAIGDKVQGNRLLALQLLVATLKEHDQGHFDGRYYRNVSPLDITRHFTLADVVAAEDEDDETDEPRLRLVEALASVRNMGVDELVDELTTIVARGCTSPNKDVPASFFELVQPEIAFDPRAYFERTTKPFILRAWADMTDPAAGEKALKGSAGDVLAKAVQRAADTGWLPPQLRMPSYQGPHFLDLEDAEPDDLEEEVEDDLQAAE